MGSKPAGNGRWGHADLAGNVWEWALDWHAVPYPAPCDDCANLNPASGKRALRGGAFTLMAGQITTSARHADPPSSRYAVTGFRCAR